MAARFLNNVSLGVYGEAVRRSGYRDAKLRTMLDTLREVLSSTTPLRRYSSPTTFIVGTPLRWSARPNSAYALDQPFARGSRPRLDTGRLGIVVLDPPAPSVPGLDVERGLAGDHGHRAVPAGLDGEAVTLLPPLRCTTRPPRCASASHATTPASPSALARRCSQLGRYRGCSCTRVLFDQLVAAGSAHSVAQPKSAAP